MILKKALKMKLILGIFEQSSGMKINFHNSGVFFVCFGKANAVEHGYINLFGCEASSFPFKYLGITIHHSRLNNSEWKSIEDLFERKLTNCVGTMLSYGDRLVLVNSVLTSFPSFFKIPKGVRKR
jgi:hypothetical protein